jgi:hypothetical protein
MRGAGGGGIGDAVRMAAVRGLKIASMPDIDTNSYRGMQAALESGAPEVLEALYRQSVKLGGTGEAGEAIFNSIAARGMNVYQSDRLFRQLKLGKGRLPQARDIRAFGNNLDERLAGVEGTDAYRMQTLKSDMETQVYEPIGEKLKPVAMDLQEAGKRVAERLAGATDALSLATELMSGIGAAANYLRNQASAPARAIFEFSLLGGSAATVAARQAFVAAAQYQANQQGGVSQARKHKNHTPASK